MVVCETKHFWKNNIFGEIEVCWKHNFDSKKANNFFYENKNDWKWNDLLNSTHKTYIL